MTQQLKAFVARAGATAVVAATAMTRVAYAAPTQLNEGATGAKPTGAEENLFTDGGIFQDIANTLIFIVGAVSVIMLIIGGLRYVMSGGESSAVKGAKDTILYAIIGIVVAALSFAAVRFVIGRL